MSTEIMIRYALVFFLPTIYLYMLATFVFARSYHLKIAKLVTAFLLCGAVGFTFDFVRVLAPTEYNSMIHLFIVLPLVNLGFSIVLHIVYLLVIPVRKIRLPIMPYLLYFLPILMMIYGVLEIFIWDQSVYYKLDGWVYRANGPSIEINVILAVLLYVLNLVLLFLGWKHTKSKHMKKFFMTCLLFTLVIIVGVISWHAGWDYLNYFIPPTAGLFVILLTGTLFAFLIRNLDFIPSIVKRYSSLMETSPTPIIYIDGKRNIIEVNTMAENIFQIKPKTKLDDYFGFNKNRVLLDRLFRELEEQSFIKGFEVTFFDELDEENYLLIDASAVQIGEETLYYLMIHNVTIEYKQRKIKDFLAYHDFLTGIYNRAYFEKFVVEQLKEIERNQGEAAILLCDLNFFKQINDTHGHQVGDQVLVYATELFKKFLPQPNVLARLGGDEFIVLFESIASKELFLQQIERVRTKFVENPYVKGDLSIEVVPSFGIVFTQEDGYEFHTLYLLADVRMYENKKLLKNIETF